MWLEVNKKREFCILGTRFLLACFGYIGSFNQIILILLFVLIGWRAYELGLFAGYREYQKGLL